jgi:hypothetical protein
MRKMLLSDKFYFSVLVDRADRILGPVGEGFADKRLLPPPCWAEAAGNSR